MNLFAPPEVIEPRVFSRMPDSLRRATRTAWADFNKAGQPVDCFLEGPSFDATGNLVVTDIPHGRIFKVSPSGAWASSFMPTAAPSSPTTSAVSWRSICRAVKLLR